MSRKALGSELYVRVSGNILFRLISIKNILFQLTVRVNMVGAAAADLFFLFQPTLYTPNFRHGKP